MAIIASPIIMGAKYAVALGRIGRLNRRNPYVPIFRRTADRITEPAVGASVCASGNHVWNGNIGTLMAKHRKKARKTHHCRLYGRLMWAIWVMSKLCAAVAVAGVWK